MPNHPLAEVFGFPIDNFSSEAHHHRNDRLCPFNNRVPNCTKDKFNDPLGVCSLYNSQGEPTVICPVRFREKWLIAEDAANFFFPAGASWTSLGATRLNDAQGKSAGNIDIVLASHDEKGTITDFGAIEIQAVYISGNIRKVFEHYMADPSARYDLDWTIRKNYPRADYLSSSRKRLAPQLVYKGGILNEWGKKLAVVVHASLYNTLPALPEVSRQEADLAWMLYDLEYNEAERVYNLVHKRTIYTKFHTALQKITTADSGPISDFVGKLQKKLEDRLQNG